MRKMQHLKSRSRQFLCLALVLMILIGMVPEAVLAEEGASVANDTATTENVSSTKEPSSEDDTASTNESSAIDGAASTEEDSSMDNAVSTEESTADDGAASTEEESSVDDAVSTEDSSSTNDTASSEESATTEDSVADEVTYDPQPTTMEEVQAAIDAADDVRSDALASGLGSLEALEAWIAAKPHWQYSVNAAIMPEGYDCELVSDDMDFGAEYYTFFVGAVAKYDSTDTWNGSSVSPFTIGIGSETEPFEIYTCAQLAYLAQQVNAGNVTYMDANYKLMADLNLNSYGWTPIGQTSATASITEFFNDQTKAFRGVFNGNGHKIYNLTVTGTTYRGLFGYTYNTKICDLTIVDATVSGTSFIGVMVGGAADDLIIDNCNVINEYKTSSVTATGATNVASGGLVGHAALTTEDKTVSIKNCKVYTKVNSTATYGCVGGLIGRVRARDYSYLSQVDDGDKATVEIENCFTYGDVTSSYYYVGGLIGHFYTLNADEVTFEIKDSGTSGNVTTTGATGYYVGGAVGFLEHTGNDTDINMSGITTTGKVETQGTSGYMVGGLIGYLHGAAAKNMDIGISDCHSTGIVISAGDKTDAGAAYGAYAGGLIGSTIITSTVTQSTLDIKSCSATGDYVTGTGYYGYYVGGLFGYILIAASYETTNITDCYSTCKVYTGAGTAGNSGYEAYDVGGLGGYMATSGDHNNTTVESCYATGDVSTGSGPGMYCGYDARYVGGLFGYVYTHDSNAAVTTPSTGSGYNTTRINNCYAKGNVSTGSGGGTFCGYNADNVGGLIGYFTVPAIYDLYVNTSSAKVSNCYATGEVATKGDYAVFVGGLIGQAHNADVYTSYAKGNVTSVGTFAGYVGGMVGITTRGVEVSRCYANGDVSATGSSAYYVGGLLGNMLSSITYTGGGGMSSIKESYATGYVTGGCYNNGGLVGYVETGGSISDSYAIGGVKGSGINNGALIGRTGGGLSYIITVTNCYASGTVTNSTGGNKGGLIGDAYYATVTNCFYDTTMTGMNVAIGGSGTGSTIGATGQKTEKMIDVTTYSAWNISENRGSGSGGSTVWYIDDNITYPYLWYQYEGHNANDTNYNLSSVTYTKTSGSTGSLVDRTDFTTGTETDGIDIQTSGGLTFGVTSAGAVEAYYPYNHQKDPINKASATSVSSANNWTIYSLGSISATDIVAYTNGPGAEKSSDRGDDTYVGDTVTYTITLNNVEDPDPTDQIDYTWKDVKVNDDLPDGLVLNTGTVVITYPDGTTVTSTEGSGEGQYEYAESTNTLTVYIGNIGAGETVTVVFETTVLESAVGEIIRNKGTATGVFLEKNYTANFDDENDIPVLGAYKVTYYENDELVLNSEGSYVDSYYKDGESYEVLGNDTTAFTKTGYVFTGWNTERDGSGTSYAAGDTFTMPAADVVLYAQWEAATDFSFLKVDADGYTTALSGAIFELYVCTGSANDHTHTDFDAANSCWNLVDTQTSADGSGGTTLGLVNFTGLSNDTYLLVEKTAPNGYELPKGQWIIKIEDGTVTSEGILGNSDIPALKTASSAQIEEGIDLLVGNLAKYALPMSGSSGIFWIMVAGALLAAAGTAGLVWLKRREKKAL